MTSNFRPLPVLATLTTKHPWISKTSVRTLSALCGVMLKTTAKLCNGNPNDILYRDRTKIHHEHSTILSL